EIDVPRAQREPVFLPHRRRNLDLNPVVEVAHQPPDHRHLLRVLLTEVGAIRLDRDQELRHDRRDSLEMTRTRLTLEPLGDVAHVDSRARARGIPHLGRWRVDRVDLRLVPQARVVRRWTWVAW